MEAKKELLKHQRFKLREEKAFYKRLSCSVENNLVSQRVHTSLSDSFASEHSVKDRKYTIEFDKFPSNDVIRLMPKPRPRDILKSSSSNKMLKMKQSKFSRFNSQTLNFSSNKFLLKPPN